RVAVVGAFFTAMVLSSISLARPVAADPPPFQTAASLLDNAGYAAALGEAVTGPEDDGGTVGGDGSQRSQVRVLGASGLRYQINLNTFATTDAAVAAYNQAQTQYSQGVPPTPIPGAGEQAFQSKTYAFAQHGAQVLAITLTYSGAAEDALDAAKTNGTDFTATLEAFNQHVVTLTQALAPKLDGLPVTTAQSFVPADAVDACAGEPALAAQYIAPDATAEGLIESERPPATACFMEAGGETLQLFVITDAQLASSLAATTAAAQYAVDLANAQAGATSGGGTVTESDTASARIFSTILPEVSAEALVTGPSGTPYLVTLEVPGSFNVEGGEAAYAAQLVQMVQAVPAAIEAPPPPPTTIPPPATAPPPTDAPTTTIAPLVTTVSTLPVVTTPNVTIPTTVVAPVIVPPTHSSDSGNGATVAIVVILIVLAAGAGGVIAARRKGFLLAGGKPSVRGVAGDHETEITSFEGAWNIGVAAVPGESEHGISIGDSGAITAATNASEEEHSDG
ncbi:MAG TPA: hypothetical protein VGM78_06065, partial [Ilumatobacteraceae bacterium]